MKDASRGGALPSAFHSRMIATAALPPLGDRATSKALAANVAKSELVTKGKAPLGGVEGQRGSGAGRIPDWDQGVSFAAPGKTQCSVSRFRPQAVLLQAR